MAPTNDRRTDEARWRRRHPRPADEKTSSAYGATFLVQNFLSAVFSAIDRSRCCWIGAACALCCVRVGILSIYTIILLALNGKSLHQHDELRPLLRTCNTCLARVATFLFFAEGRPSTSCPYQRGCMLQYQAGFRRGVGLQSFLFSKSVVLGPPFLGNRK